MNKKTLGYVANPILVWLSRMQNTLMSLHVVDLVKIREGRKTKTKLGMTPWLSVSCSYLGTYLTVARARSIILDLGYLK